MKDPKVSIRNKRGGVRVVKTVTKGVNPEGKKYRTVEKSVERPNKLGAPRGGIYTTKTKVRGGEKYGDAYVFDKEGRYSSLGYDSYKEGRSAQREMIRSGREATGSQTGRPRKIKYNRKAQGGVQTGFLKRAVQSVFGGGRESNASTPKPKKNWSSNPARAARQKERARGNERVCGPGGCMKRKKLERLRDR